MASEGVKPLLWDRPIINLLAGERLHLNHGPIDIIIKAVGESNDVKAAYAAVVDRFQTVIADEEQHSAYKKRCHPERRKQKRIQTTINIYIDI